MFPLGCNYQGELGTFFRISNCQHLFHHFFEMGAVVTIANDDWTTNLHNTKNFAVTVNYR